MKIVRIIPPVIFLMICFLHAGCEKDKLAEVGPVGNTNKAPIANAGADQIIILPVNSVLLNGQSSGDPDGSIRKWRWQKIAGPGTGTIQLPDSSLTNVNDLSAGVYSFELVVTDDKGLTAIDTTRLFVDAVPTSNHPPIALAGPDQFITLPTNTVTLDGRASSDPENNITGQQWTKISGPAASITNANMLLTAVTQMVEGIYAFELKLTDAGGLEARDTVHVTVTAQTILNLPPVANAGFNQTLPMLATSTTLNGIASSDPNNNIVSYRWTRVSGPVSVQFQNPSNLRTLVTQLTPGMYQFQLTVTDAGGLTDSNYVYITVPFNNPPSAHAGVDQVITLPVTTTVLKAYFSTDPEGNITGYAWRQISGPTQSTFLNPTSSATWVSNLSPGTYKYEVTVTDAGNLFSKDTVQVNVIGIPTASPAIFDWLYWTGNCELQIPSISSVVPASGTFTVHVKRFELFGGPSDWMLVRPFGSQQPGDFGYYEIVNGTLSVSSLTIDCGWDDADSYSIRVTY